MVILSFLLSHRATASSRPELLRVPQIDPSGSPLALQRRRPDPSKAESIEIRASSSRIEDIYRPLPLSTLTIRMRDGTITLAGNCTSDVVSTRSAGSTWETDTFTSKTGGLYLTDMPPLWQPLRSPPTNTPIRPTLTDRPLHAPRAGLLGTGVGHGTRLASCGTSPNFSRKLILKVPDASNVVVRKPAVAVVIDWTGMNLGQRQRCNNAVERAHSGAIFVGPERCAVIHVQCLEAGVRDREPVIVARCRGLRIAHIKGDVATARQ